MCDQITTIISKLESDEDVYIFNVQWYQISEQMESNECINILLSHLFPCTISVVVIMVVVVYMCRLGGGDCIWRARWYHNP